MSLAELTKKMVEQAVRGGAYQAEVTAFSMKEALTRYTKNVIHQNDASSDYGVGIKVVIDKNKIGGATVNSLNEKNILGGVEEALKIAKVSRPDPEFKTLPEPKTIVPLKGAFHKETAEYTPEEMAEGVKTVIENALAYNKNVKWSAGSFTVTTGVLAIANSLGVAAESEFSEASIDVITRAQSVGSEGSGFRVKRSRNVKELDFKAVALDAAKDAVDSMNAKQIPLGEYEAVFRPEAVSTFIGFLGRLGFSALVYQLGQSFLKDKLGTQLFDEKLTIWDNGRDLRTLSPMAFDGEGVRKKALMLVNGGVPENLCYDTYTALKEGRESTGHALPRFGRGFFGGMPMPMNQVISPGDASMDELIEETRKGVLVTRLHYVNAIRGDLGIISGMTSDGLWFIENGEIKHPLQQMRFTDSVLRVFRNLDALGDESTVEKTSICTTPAIKTALFKFTGQTEF